MEPKDPALAHSVIEKVKSFLEDGRKLQAINYLVKECSLSLKQAKEIVDAIE